MNLKNLPKHSIPHIQCPRFFVHESHDWVRMYRHSGLMYRTEDYVCDGLNAESYLIHKPCVLKVDHEAHAWNLPYLDGRVWYYCEGLNR